MTDEAGALRAALECGEWEALLAPGAEALLVLLLLDRADWWPKALHRMANEMQCDVADGRTERVMSDDDLNLWHELKHGLRWGECADIDLRWLARALPDAGPEFADHRRALAVLEQWPAG